MNHNSVQKTTDKMVKFISSRFLSVKHMYLLFNYFNAGTVLYKFNRCLSNLTNQGNNDPVEFTQNMTIL